MYTSETRMSSKLAPYSFFYMSANTPSVYFWVYPHYLLQTDMHEDCWSPSESGANLHWHGSYVAEDLAHNLPVWSEMTVICLQKRWGKLLTCFQAKYLLLFPVFGRAHLYLTRGDEVSCLEGGACFLWDLEWKRQQPELLRLTWKLKRLWWAARSKQTSALPESHS